jgi:hypothetical protein
VQSASRLRRNRIAQTPNASIASGARLGRQGRSEIFGARPLKRLIQQSVQDRSLSASCLGAQGGEKIVMFDDRQRVAFNGKLAVAAY